MRSPNPPLGGLSVDDFMRRHWQRRPLLVRGAFPGFRSPIDPAEVFALAERDDVESRLITAFSARWKLRHGPFAPDELPSRGRRNWTLLVQGVDTLHDAARTLIERFRFVADARLDDLMISFATDGGGERCGLGAAERSGQGPGTGEGQGGGAGSTEWAACALK